ncbi:MAG: hypothetical protein ACLRWC_02000, partial [Acutalibacter sp.]
SGRSVPPALGFKSPHLRHIKEQSLIQKQPSKSEGCFCIYARKAHNIRLSGLFLFSGDLVDYAVIILFPIVASI